MRSPAILIVALVASGCGILGLDGVTHRTLEVAPYKAGCTGVGPMLCLQVREVGETDFRNLFETPRGFEFEWGFDYLIVVEEREREEFIPDASSIVRRLDRVLSKEPIPSGTTFELFVASEVLSSSGDSRYTLFSEPIELECSIGPTCEDFATDTSTRPRLRIMLEFPDTSGEPLQIVDWIACTEMFGPCLSS